MVHFTDLFMNINKDFVVLLYVFFLGGGAKQCCGTVTIYYGSGSGSDF